MDPTNNITPTLRIQPLSPYQGGGQQQRTPFSPGQLLQGLISAQSDHNQFTLDISGRQIQVESTAQLQVGQKLHLQVVTLTPQVELHIVNSNAVNRMIGNSIHLIGQQTFTFSALAHLAEISGRMPQLSTNSRETLQFYADTITTRSPVAASFTLQRQPQLTVQLLSRAIDTFATPQSQNTKAMYEEIGNLLQQLSLTPSFSLETAERANNLATVFLHAGNLHPSAGVSVQEMSTNATVFVPTADTAHLLTQLGKLSQNDPQVLNLIDRLIPLLVEIDVLPDTHPLRQLVAFLAEMKNVPAGPQSLLIAGPQLQEVVERLGIDMEQLLANNSREKAVQTLKQALLELSQQLPSGDKNFVQTDQIIKSLELYHLLQVRLASESLFFVPLPFPFLDQGYLLIDADQPGKKEENNNNSAKKPLQRFELHLQLEGLGNLQIDFREDNGGVTLKFLAEDTERAKFLAGFRAELDQWLTAANLESVQFRVGAQEPVRLLLEKIMGGATGMVDTNA